ncbi:MAG: gamma-glutamyltranspeptidase [Sedimenticola thiotaurini]|uniref:Gamma-glutamyltranspeptidase n=1 Tax=Sedimenticola thiotaurini TaxID=1543721 RepID=A0A558DG20_9GAMM|nr:MAG: gamma-glutamyltranspeptidase [Sedimenticola thiotaurini]
MTMTNSTLKKLAAMALTLGLVTGCASTDQIKKMQADIADLKDNTSAAMSAARDAKLTADTADRKASAAMNAANAAQASADECAEKCDRIMQKSMAK